MARSPTGKELPEKPRTHVRVQLHRWFQHETGFVPAKASAPSPPVHGNHILTKHPDRRTEDSFVADELLQLGNSGRERRNGWCRYRWCFHEDDRTLFAG